MVMSNSKKGTPQRLKTKYCVFPGCGVEYVGRGKSKYCPEHSKAKYRKVLYKQNDNNGEGIVRIEHTEFYAKSVTRTCGLEGCNNEYDIILLPQLYEYPAYCEEHRNSFKRERFIKDNE